MLRIEPMHCTLRLLEQRMVRVIAVIQRDRCRTGNDRLVDMRRCRVAEMARCRRLRAGVQIRHGVVVRAKVDTVLRHDAGIQMKRLQVERHGRLPIPIVALVLHRDARGPGAVVVRIRRVAVVSERR
jgi:hypothetical protein